MHLTNHPTVSIGAIWMELVNREKLQRRMEREGVSQRELARAAGWKSHSYLRRLLTGEAKTLNTDPALRIAHYLHLDVDDVFVTRVSTERTHSPGADRRQVERAGARRTDPTAERAGARRPRAKAVAS